MTGTTPVYGLRYGTGSDPVSAIATYSQDLAEDVESTIAGFGGIAAPGSWHLVGGSGEPAFGSGWSAFGGQYVAPSFRKVGGEVFIRAAFLRGGSSSGVGSGLFTLPTGYVPLKNHIFPGDTGGLYAQITVYGQSATFPGLVTCGPSVAAAGNVAFVSPPIWLD